MAAWRSTTDRKAPRFRRRLVSVAKKVSTALSQEHEVGVKWKTKRGWRGSQTSTFGWGGGGGEPSQHLWLRVGGVVVEDEVDDLADRDLCLDGIEEADELLMAVALHAAPEDGAVEDVKGGEQGGGAVALVIMGHGAGAALLQRQAGLSAVKRLDLALLVDRQHHRMSRRVDVEPDNVTQLWHEVGVGGELKAAG